MIPVKLIPAMCRGSWRIVSALLLVSGSSGGISFKVIGCMVSRGGLRMDEVRVGENEYLARHLS